MAGDVRWVTFVGADGSGKTALIEDALYIGKAIKKFRRLEGGGSSPIDVDEEEKKRNFTLQSRPFTCTYKKHRLILWDTPGFSEFIGETRNMVRIGDMAVLVINASRAFKDITSLFVDLLLEMKKPFIVFISHMDDPEADFEGTVSRLEEVLGQKPVVMTWPVGSGENFKGYADVLSGEAYYFEEKFTGKVKKGELPDEIKEKLSKIKENLIETAIEVDDALTEKYLEGEQLSDEEILQSMRQSFREGHFIPVVAGSAFLNVGVMRILDLIVETGPSPEEVPPWHGKVDGDEKDVPLRSDRFFSAYVVKNTVDHYAGKVSYLRVISGKASSDMMVQIPGRGEKFKIPQVVTLEGLEQVTVQEVVAGDILIIKKVDALKAGLTICDESVQVEYPPFELPRRTLAYVVKPKGKSSEEKVSGAIQKIMEEDVLLEATRDADTKELLLWGMGQVHLEVTQERLKRKFGVEIEYELPKVPYRETIKGKAQAQGKYKKQSGGRGQYGDAWIQIEPLPRGKGFEFVDMIKGGVIPKNFIPAVEKGVKEAMEHGPLAGYPVVDVKVTLYDGSYHEVDSSDIAFQIAGSLAFKNAVQNARPTLLEPIMKLEISVPEEFVGGVMNDLNSRRAKIMGMDMAKHGKVIKAEAPMAELLTYAPQLRALTQGLGTFTMEFSHYEEVPPNLQEKIIQESPYKKASEE